MSKTMTREVRSGSLKSGSSGPCWTSTAGWGRVKGHMRLWEPAGLLGKARSNAVERTSAPDMVVGRKNLQVDGAQAYLSRVHRDRRACIRRPIY